MTVSHQRSAPAVTALAASHRAVRVGLQALLGSDDDIALVATADDARGAARCLLQHHPDVLVIALTGALGDGGALIRTLRTLAPDTALIVAGTGASNAHRSVARAAGATAFLALDGPPEDLLQAVRAAAVTRSAAR